MTATSIEPQRSFVPADLDLANADALEALYRRLLDRPIHNSAELEGWLADFSELTAAVDEYGSRRYIDKSCHTEDAEIEKRFLHFVENVEPRTKPLFFALQQKFLESPYRAALKGRRFEMLDRNWRADVDVFRDQNVPIETEVTKIVNEYDKIFGRMMVEFRGGQYTMQQMSRFLDESQRTTRQEAWEATTRRRLENHGEVEEIFERLLPLRQQIARNAGLLDFRDYAWKARKRFDYTPEDCLEFSEAIAEHCVPLVNQLNSRRSADLGVGRLRPWDLEVDPHGRPPLRPFKEDQIATFVQKTREIFDRLSPELARDFESLETNHNLDLQSRKGKQPGGYQMSLEESRQPFIFMNAAGVQRDIETLLHEGGHAFHFLAACRNEPLCFLRGAPMEFCEVASMSMELLGSEHFDVFYDEAQASRARRKLIEGIIRFLPWMATIDSFQHWIYTHPEQTRQQRRDFWLGLLNRFGGNIDWAGYETARATLWQRQLHLFHSPFYYIEYGIAQLGALQLWLKAKMDARGALASYRAALSLGGTRPLPELFAAAGIQFDLSSKTLRPLMQALGEELARVDSD
ncbi:MAG TPA: M3 family oligoendopeptidase [Tepidisphaeraceae bacterium]|nr:M3 family oligoendopeptidase [Tepidisphaeraceae bacterium]